MMNRNIGKDRRTNTAIPANNAFLDRIGFIKRNATIRKKNKGTRKWAVAYAYMLSASKAVPARNQSGFRSTFSRQKKAKENTNGRRLDSSAHREIIICQGLMAIRNIAMIAADGEKSFPAIPYTTRHVRTPAISIGRRIIVDDRPRGTNGAK